MAAMKRQSQADKILQLLEYYLKFNGGWVDLPTLMVLQIASHTRRISDLRKRGYNIECQRETVNGQVRTKYRLVQGGK